MKGLRASVNSVEGCFPMRIRFIRDNAETIVYSSKEIPSGKAFKVLETNVRIELEPGPTFIMDDCRK